MRPGSKSGGAPLFRPASPIVIIGPMAVGKSVIGAELARVIDVPFFDSDQRIVAKHGPIANIFSSRGEQYFRELEARAVAQVLDFENPTPVVLSLGGGAVLDSGTQQLVKKATVIYLSAQIETVKERILRNSARPLLASDPVATWTRLAEKRGPVYERLADITLEVSKASIPELVERIIWILAGKAEDQENPSSCDKS